MTAKPGKYLTFELCGHMYAVSIDKVLNIINGAGDISPVPEFPEYGKGAISLWGYVIPVIDPRIRLNLPGTENAPTTCLVIVGNANEDGSVNNALGLMVDKINTIMDFDESGLCEAPRLTAGTGSYITGVYKAPAAIIMIIEPKLLLTEDMSRAIDEYMESHS